MGHYPHDWHEYPDKSGWECARCSAVTIRPSFGDDSCEAPAQDDSPALQGTDEGFESPGGRQSPWNERDAHNRELSGRIDAKRQIIALLQDEIRQLEEQKLT